MNAIEPIKILEFSSRVLWNRMVCSGYFRLGLTCDSSFHAALPGQFIMVRFPEGLDPLLRRPFSIHRLISADEGNEPAFEILFKMVGKTTERLARVRAGERLDALGPLGRPFQISAQPGRIFLAAGGIGVAPMFFLSSELNRRGAECRVFLGARSKDDLLCRDDFFEAGVRHIDIATDDGSAGEKDWVTGPLARAIRQYPPRIIYACGPTPMLRAVAKLAAEQKIACQISFETKMACGVGACLGCAVRSAEYPARYFHACKDGPVFDAGEILF